MVEEPSVHRLSRFISLEMARYLAQRTASPFLLSACWWSLSERLGTGWSSLFPAVSAAVRGDVEKNPLVTRQSYCRAVSAFVRAHLGHLKIFHEGEASQLSLMGEAKFSHIVEDNSTVGRVKIRDNCRLS